MIEDVGKPEKEKDGEVEEENNGSSEDETDDGHSSNTDRDQDSDISFMNATDEEIDSAEFEEEKDWIEYMKRSTDEAMKRMKTAKIQCWIKAHRRMKWRLTMRTVSLPEERWLVKAAEWNPEPTELWEDQEKDGKMESMTSSVQKELKMS